jgi:hypothetical protein
VRGRSTEHVVAFPGIPTADIKPLIGRVLADHAGYHAEQPVGITAHVVKNAPTDLRKKARSVKD